MKDRLAAPRLHLAREDGDDPLGSGCGAMALWTNHDEKPDRLYTTVYFLRDALESALDHAAVLRETPCRKPSLIRGAGHAEIAARLTRFRSSFNELRCHEAMMVTKILRAREWASELKRAAPRIRADAEQFMDATAGCEDIQTEYVSDPQRLFHGGEMPARFLGQRNAGYFEAGPEGRTPSQDYRVGGRIDLLELRVACEVFLSQIDQCFFSETPPAPAHDNETIVPHLPLPEDEDDAIADAVTDTDEAETEDENGELIPAKEEETAPAIH